MTISLVRIDDRLIHGQVVMTWINHTKSNAVHIVDDQVARDEFMQKVLRAVAPSGVEIVVADVATAQQSYRAWEESPKRILVLVRYPQTIGALMDSGAAISSVNLAGLGSAPGKRQLFRNISISPEEGESLRRIMDAGAEVFIQMLATERRSVLTRKMLD